LHFNSTKFELGTARAIEKEGGFQKRREVIPPTSQGHALKTGGWAEVRQENGQTKTTVEYRVRREHSSTARRGKPTKIKRERSLGGGGKSTVEVNRGKGVE